MRPIRILLPDGQPLAERAFQAESLRERMRGWLGREAPQAGEGLLIGGASSVHSFGMRFSFDLAFLDREGRVLALHPALRPGRVAFGPLGAWLALRGLQALELPEGALAAKGVQAGQVLRWEER